MAPVYYFCMRFNGKILTCINVRPPLPFLLSIRLEWFHGMNLNASTDSHIYIYICTVSSCVVRWLLWHSRTNTFTHTCCSSHSCKTCLGIYERQMGYLLLCLRQLNFCDICLQRNRLHWRRWYWCSVAFIPMFLYFIQLHMCCKTVFSIVFIYVKSNY